MRLFSSRITVVDCVIAPATLAIRAVGAPSPCSASSKMVLSASGATCACHLGPYCRTHHKIKQLPGWTLIQIRPGFFQLTTPAGRSYSTGPDPYPA